jgi:hypothetical protein
MELQALVEVHRDSLLTLLGDRPTQPVLVRQAAEYSGLTVEWLTKYAGTLTAELLTNARRPNFSLSPDYRGECGAREAGLADALTAMAGGRGRAHHSVRVRLSSQDARTVLQHRLPLPQLSALIDFTWSGVWVGPNGARTPLHCDGWDGVLVICQGAKRVYLFPPNSIDSTAPSVTAARHVPQRALTRLGGLPDGYYAEVRQGDALFIPVSWWHDIENFADPTTAAVLRLVPPLKNTHPQGV